MKNRISIRILAAILSVTVLFCIGGTTYATSEEKPSETVYVVLDANGTARKIIAKSDTAEENDAKGELPFTIKISYLFNDKQVIPQDILGMSGNVKITIDIATNSKSKTYYKENLALQMQFPIETKQGFATDIIAEGLTSVTIGTIQTLSGIVLPSKSAKYEVSYKTQAFELQSANFVCMPFDLTSMVDIDIASIKTQVTQLQSGVAQYVDGVDQTSKGLSKANMGLKKISSNGAQLIDGYTQTTTGENTLMQAMLATMTPEQQKAFGPQVQAIQAGQKQMSNSLTAYIGGVTQASTGLNQLTEAAAKLAKSGVMLKENINSAITPLSDMLNDTTATSVPESFLASEKVSAIQFVMKTDALTAIQPKEDILPVEKPKETFWSRLMALFGL